jgi:hypothetical protein
MHSTSIKAMTHAATNARSQPLALVAKQTLAKYLLSPWTLTIATCLLLATSGGIRFWRDCQFKQMAREGGVCPIALNEFPMILGERWYADQNSNPQLAPEITRIAGANSYMMRNYIDKKSGAVVLALLLYGPANSVFAHSPEICYPASGYQPVMKPDDHQFSDSSSPFPRRFRSAFFSKSSGVSTQYEEVYYTFYYNQQWLPEVANQWKLFRYHPGMFKLLLQRQTTDLSTENSPTESLLREIVREVDARIGQNQTPAATAMTPGKPATR